MNVRIFTATGGKWTGRLELAPLETEMASWFSANSSILVREIRHDVVATLWAPPQLIVSIYFD
jgi:hypothetical protein